MASSSKILNAPIFSPQTDDEKKMLAYIEDAIKNPDKINELIEITTTRNLVTIYRLCEQSPVFKDFCRNDKKLKEAWSNYLKENNCPSMEIKTQDGKEFDIFNHIMGLALIDECLQTQNNNAERQYLMYLACEQGLFKALFVRCKVMLSAIKLSVHGADYKKKTEQFLESVNGLGNHYWGYGYYKAGDLLLEASNYFASLHQLAINNKDPNAYDFLDRAKAFCAASIQNYLTANFFASNEYSNVIFRNIPDGKTFLDGIRNFEEWVTEKMTLFKGILGQAFDIVYDQANKKFNQVIMQEDIVLEEYKNSSLVYSKQVAFQYKKRETLQPSVSANPPEKKF